MYINQASNLLRQPIANGEVLGRYGIGIDEINPRGDGGNPIDALSALPATA